jgi:hypothetical protein
MVPGIPWTQVTVTVYGLHSAPSDRLSLRALGRSMIGRLFGNRRSRACTPPFGSRLHPSRRGLVDVPQATGGSLIPYRRSSIDLASCEQRRCGVVPSPVCLDRDADCRTCPAIPLPAYYRPAPLHARQHGGWRQSPSSAFSYPRRRREDVKCSSLTVQTDLKNLFTP